MNLEAHLPILAIIIPLISAFVIPLFGRINKAFAWYIAISAIFLSFLISVSLLNSVLADGTIRYRLGGWEPPWGIEYVVDYLSGFVMVIVSAIAVVMTLYAKKSVEKEIDESRINAFYAIYLLLFTGLMGMTITGDIFNLYVFIEITALSGYALSAAGKKRDALIATYNYLILGTIAATFILIGIGYLYIVTGTLNMADLKMRLPGLYGSTSVMTAFAFITVGLSLKLALFPFHIWLPNVYTHAPSVVSSLMAATGTKVALYVLLRMMFTVFTVDFYLKAVPATTIFLILGILAIISGSIIAISQTNIKRMLAYSSVGQIGYMVLGVGLANPLALTGSLIHILNHALMKGTLFMAAGAVFYMTGAENISDLRGMGRKMPFTMAAFTIGSLSMIGFPLTVGFVSKWYLAMGAIKSGMWWLVPVILLSSLLTAVYLLRVIETIYFSETGKETTPEDAPAGMVIPILILASLCLVFGIFTFMPVVVASRAVTLLLGVQ